MQIYAQRAFASGRVCKETAIYSMMSYARTSGRGMQRDSHLQHDELCKEADICIRARYAKRQPFTAGRGYAKKYMNVYSKVKYAKSYRHLHQGEVCKEAAIYFMARYAKRQPFTAGRGMQTGNHLQYDKVCKEAAIYIRASYTKRYKYLLQGQVYQEALTAWPGMQRQPFTAWRGIQRAIYSMARYAKSHLQHGEVCKEPFTAWRGMQRAIYSMARYAKRYPFTAW